MTSDTVSDQRPRRPAVSRLSLRSLLSVRGLGAVAALVLLLGVGWLWFRSSSFVQVKSVTVTGLSGPNVKAIRSALTDTAETMTVLNLSTEKLDQSVSQYPTVRSLSVSTSFPHSVTIAVNEEVPVAELMEAGRLVAIDSAGRLLSGSSLPHDLLPSLGGEPNADNGIVTGSGAVAALRVLRAAPYAFLAHVRSATWTAAHGVTLELRTGPALYFGSQAQAQDKWTAAIAVLADVHSHGAAYIDVTDPQHPAAGA